MTRDRIHSMMLADPNRDDTSRRWRWHIAMDQAEGRHAPKPNIVWFFGGRKYYTEHPNADDRPDLPDLG